MKPVYYLIFLSIVFTSCIKESMTESSNYFFNSSDHMINVQAFRDGQVLDVSSFTLNGNSEKLVFQTINGGIGEGICFCGGGSDSIVVTFDSLYSITHYTSNFSGSNPNSYSFNSKRNIYNGSNYLTILKDVSKFRREWEFKYTFTEQDYIDAR